jgi:hypothetical protein
MEEAENFCALLASSELGCPTRGTVQAKMIEKMTETVVRA